MKTVIACAVIAVTQHANAGVVINITESGGDVKLELSGSINTGALTDFFGTFTAFNGYQAFGGNLATSGSVDTFHTNGINWTPFGAGAFGTWDTSSGDAFSMFSDPALGLPVGYVSGAAMSSSATKFGSSFASLGFDVGTFVTVLSNGSISDTVTVNIGAVPTPGTLAMVGLGGLVVTRRRR